MPAHRHVMPSIITNHRAIIQSAAMLLVIASFTSRVLGLVRDRVLVSLFGAGDTLDVYFTAFRIPDFIYNILIAGAVAAAFIPVFIEARHREEEYSWKLAANFFNIMAALLSLFAILSIIIMPWLMSLIAPGFIGEKREIAILLSRIMAISPLLLGMSAMLSGVNQAFNRFVPYAFAPIFYNIGIIFGAFMFVPILGIAGLAWGVVLGATAHFAIQIPSARLVGFRWQGVFTPRGFDFIRIAKLIIPRSIGLAASQVNVLVTTAIASLLGAGSVAIFTLADNLQYMVIGIIGISYATATFPAFSHAASGKNKKLFLDTFAFSVRHVLFWALPASVLLFVLRAQVVRVALGAGAFGWTETRLTAAVLGIFCIGIFAHSLNPVIARAFYAVQNTITPVAINIGGILINIGLSVFFVFVSLQDGMAPQLGVLFRVSDLANIPLLGLPLAFAIAGIITLIFLFGAFFARYEGEYKREIILAFIRIVFVSIIAGLVAYFVLRVMLLAPFISLTTFWGVFTQGLGAGIAGILVYLGGLFLLRAPEWTFVEDYKNKLFSALNLTKNQ
ncbi:MAG: murein biosynthesis integral membrane protein MurJ [Candidatus Spechtbacteria bacterium]|nr:murein biosynthesis integral membrane protein MurJ [Candidatus Spechtbacteria bacterium]